MGFEEPIDKYSGRIREIAIGNDHVVKAGGESTLPFYVWEGEMPHRPLIAMEVYDVPPANWPPAVMKHYQDVVDDPVKWASRCKEFGADMLCLQLLGTDPNRDNRSPEQSVEFVNSISSAVDLPLVVWGSGNSDKDAEVLKKVAEALNGKNVLLAPAVEENYKPIAAASMGYQHNLVGQSPNDVNMAKQLNILITQLGQDPARVVVDATTGGLGYGLEYTYSVIERLRLAALQQNDSMAQMPVINDLAKEVWRAKEAITSEEEEPAWGDQEKRGVLWEAVTAVAFLLAGSDILVMRHPESVRLVRQIIQGLGVNSN